MTTLAQQLREKAPELVNQAEKELRTDLENKSSRLSEHSLRKYKWLMKKTFNKKRVPTKVGPHTKYVEVKEPKQENRIIFDATPEELQQWYSQCFEMVNHNPDEKSGKIGRLYIVEELRKLKDRVLAVDYMLKEMGKWAPLEALQFVGALQREGTTEQLLGEVRNVDKIYREIPISIIFEVSRGECKVSAPSFTHLFIAKQHSKFTAEERKELKLINENIMAAAVQELQKIAGKELQNYIPYNKNGYTLTQLKELMKTPGRLLHTLTEYQRQELYLNLIDQLIERQMKKIDFWQEKADEIREVADYRNITLS